MVAGAAGNDLDLLRFFGNQPLHWQEILYAVHCHAQAYEIVC